MQSGLKCVLLTKIRPLVEERPALVGGKSDSHCTRVLSAACNKDGKDKENLLRRKIQLSGAQTANKKVPPLFGR